MSETKSSSPPKVYVREELPADIPAGIAGKLHEGDGDNPGDGRVVGADGKVVSETRYPDLDDLFKKAQADR